MEKHLKKLSKVIFINFLSTSININKIHKFF
jgi:hypothetical protein